jgi:hypothetical protein
LGGSGRVLRKGQAAGLLLIWLEVPPSMLLMVLPWLSCWLAPGMPLPKPFGCAGWVSGGGARTEVAEQQIGTWSKGRT